MNQMLDHIDTLTRAAAAQPDDIADILEESLAVEQRLAEAREATWLAWAHQLGLFSIYDAAIRAQKELTL